VIYVHMPTHYERKAVCKPITNMAKMENIDIIFDELYTDMTSLQFSNEFLAIIKKNRNIDTSSCF